MSKNLLGLARPQKASSLLFFIFGELVVLIFDLITGMLKDLTKSFSFLSLSPVNIILSISFRPRSTDYLNDPAGKQYPLPNFNCLSTNKNFTSCFN